MCANRGLLFSYWNDFLVQAKRELVIHQGHTPERSRRHRNTGLGHQSTVSRKSHPLETHCQRMTNDTATPVSGVRWREDLDFMKNLPSFYQEILNVEIRYFPWFHTQGNPQWNVKLGLKGRVLTETAAIQTTWNSNLGVSLPKKHLSLTVEVSPASPPRVVSDFSGFLFPFLPAALSSSFPILKATVFKCSAYKLHTPS